METLLARDGKEALYKRALASEIQGVAGVDLPYEPPAHPELVVRTDLDPVEGCLTRVFQALVDGKYVTPTEFGYLTGGLKPKRKSKSGKPAAERPPKVIKVGPSKAGAKPAKAAKPAKPAAKPAAKAGKAREPAAAARKAPKKSAARTARR